MASVKLSDKESIEKLQARVTLSKGKKVSQQELLEKCIHFSTDHFDEFIQEELDSPSLPSEKISKILQNTVHSGYAFPDKSDDELIYGI
jgi:hypothetical protein